MAVLLTMAAPSITTTREKPYLAAKRSDLLRLGEAQERFKLANNDYAGSVGRSNIAGEGGGDGVVSFRPTMGSTVSLTYLDSLGWGATITNPQVTTPVHNICGIYTGHSNAYAAAAGLTIAVPELTPKCY
jgi:hypothetical protein